MKPIHLLLLLFAICIVFPAHATVWTVNNNSNSPGQYNNFAAAQSAASNGDTIYISGSPYNYGTLDVTKRLTIYGTGHNPQTQSPLASFCDYVEFDNGSQGSQIIGLQVYEPYSQVTVDSINIYLCKITGYINIQSYYCANWNIIGNVFTSTSTNISGPNFGGNIVIANNIFNGTVVTFPNNQSNYSYLNNNIFLLNNSGVFGNVYSMYANNNIFYRASPNGSSVSITFSNNLSYACGSGCTFPNGTNFTDTIPPFANFPTGGDYFSYNYDFHIVNTGIAHNAGTDGTDLGVYGGTGYFNQNGIPHLPYIETYSISNPSVAPGGTVNVSFKSQVR